MTADWKPLWWSGNFCLDSNEFACERCLYSVSTVPETLVNQNTRWRCKGRKYSLTVVSIDSGPLTFWPPPLIGLVALTPFSWRYFCIGCRKFSSKPHFDPRSSAAGCNSPRFWRFIDRHVFHILIFKQMSYSYCECGRRGILSESLTCLAWCWTDITTWRWKSVGYACW